MQNRHADRLPLVMYLDVIDAGNGDLLGHLGDISPDGMMYLSQSPAAMGEIRHINVELPDMDDIPAQTLSLTIETRWNKPNINPEWHCNGCRFVDLETGVLPVIEKIASKLSFGNNVEVNRVALA
jgi:hypothetical protein